MKLFSGSMMIFLILCGCGARNETRNVGAGDSLASALSTKSGRRRSATDSFSATPQRILGEREKRVALLVLPGDAVVEIDSVPARRRNGMVELVGKPGEKHRIVVFLDAATKVEKTVKIEAEGVSPPRIDAEEESKSKSGPAKSPVVFDNEE